MGGMINAIQKHYPQTEIADSAFKYQRQVDKNVKTIVGVNKYAGDGDSGVPTLEIGTDVEKRQVSSLLKLKNTRDNSAVENRLDDIREAAAKDENLMPAIINAVREYATLGEISDVFREIYGEYRDPGYF